MSMSHGNERWFRETEVAVKNDGTLLGLRTKALDDAGAWLRYEPLGGVIWAQVTPGMYRWRHIELEFTQVATNKAPVSPNRGYSRMQHLWFTERIIDIVARELIDWESVPARKAEASERGKVLGVGIGSTLDSGTNNFGQSRLINPELQISG